MTENKDTIYSIFKENYDKFDKDFEKKEFDDINDFFYFVETYLSVPKIIGRHEIAKPCHHVLELLSGYVSFFNNTTSTFKEQGEMPLGSRGLHFIKDLTPSGLRLITKNWFVEFNYK